MKIIIIFIILLFFSISICSQQNEDYYLKVIDTTKNKKLKLASLDSLIHDLKNQKNFEKFANRTEQYVDLAIELKEYESAINFAIKAFYFIDKRLNQKGRALNLIEKVALYKNKTTNSFLIGNIYSKKGDAYSTSKNHKKAIENYTLAINSFKDNSKDSIYKADVLQNRGYEYLDTGNYIKSIQDHQLAATYYENLGDTQYMFYALTGIINIYSINGFNQKAIDQRNKIIEKKITENLINDIYVDYFNQSITYKKIDSFHKQEEYLLRAYTIVKEGIKDEFINNDREVLLFSSLSNFYSSQSNLIKAKKYLDEAEIKFNKLNKGNRSSYIFFKAKATYLVGLKKYNKAKNYAERANQISIKNGIVEGVMDSEKLLSEIHNKIGDKEKALTSYINYTKIKDSIFNITKTNALLYYETLHQTTRKEKEINLQKAYIILLAKENEAKKGLILFGSIGLLLMFSIFYLFINRIYLKRKKAIQEEYSHKLLLSQEAERKRISKDLHDSLGQSLLLIKNKVSLTSDDKTKELVNSAIEEVRSISRALHPFQLEDIGITRALENLIRQLDESYENTYIFGDIDDLKSSLNPNQEVNMFRIVQECLSNIIKHAKAESAKVTLINNTNWVTICIRDNGVGFDFFEKYNDFKSLGLKTIKERVKFLKGTIKINSIKDEGTTITIQIPQIDETKYFYSR
ncbi:hypothetical protein BTO04_08180 [Polaribacter sp. SA4-10]|uniref:tetratricopeptide repeat-containing sensor histidine kinase n=1 Tax=Polaribacter sp. SA4-10 TaxID=754397 RepID=UPI000B3CFC79|nr:sensor histidine kinase [Polaribacter sp. SA4-10]ARV06671.1 hypothetical protein BTO04_08180 [Polaribacter sp. SA4-10]